MQGLPFFCCFFGGKIWLLKVLLTSTFVPSLLNSSDLPNYSSESTERYTLRVCLEAQGEGVLKVVLPEKTNDLLRGKRKKI